MAELLMFVIIIISNVEKEESHENSTGSYVLTQPDR